MARHQPYEQTLRSAREHFSESDSALFYIGELERLARECADTPRPPETLHLTKLIFIASYLYHFDEYRDRRAINLASSLSGIRRFTAQDAFRNGKKAGYKDARARERAWRKQPEEEREREDRERAYQAGVWVGRNADHDEDAPPGIRSNVRLMEEYSRGVAEGRRRDESTSG